MLNSAHFSARSHPSRCQNEPKTWCHCRRQQLNGLVRGHLLQRGPWQRRPYAQYIQVSPLVSHFQKPTNKIITSTNNYQQNTASFTSPNGRGDFAAQSEVTFPRLYSRRQPEEQNISLQVHFNCLTIAGPI